MNAILVSLYIIGGVIAIYFVAKSGGFDREALKIKHLIFPFPLFVAFWPVVLFVYFLAWMDAVGMERLKKFLNRGLFLIAILFLTASCVKQGDAVVDSEFRLGQKVMIHGTVEGTVVRIFSTMKGDIYHVKYITKDGEFEWTQCHEFELEPVQ